METYSLLYVLPCNSEFIDQQWEIQIFRRDLEGRTNPPPKILTIPQQNSAIIEYSNRTDIYEYVLGSKFDFKIMDVEGGDFLNMSDGDYKEFRVDIVNAIPPSSVFYQRFGSNPERHDSFISSTLHLNRSGTWIGQLYWRGFIIPTSSKEVIIAPPYVNSFRAVDSIADLGQRTLPQQDHYMYREDKTLRLIDVIYYALEQTRIHIPLLVNSGIKYEDENSTNIDALLHGTCLLYTSPSPRDS